MIRLKSYFIDDTEITLYVEYKTWRVTSKHGKYESTRVFVDYQEASDYFEISTIGN